MSAGGVHPDDLEALADVHRVEHGSPYFTTDDDAGEEGLGIDWPDAPGLPGDLPEDDDPDAATDEILAWGGSADLTEEETELARWAAVETGLVAVLDSLADLVGRFDKIDARLDGIAKRLSDLEAAVEAEDQQPQLTVSAPVVTHEQAQEIAAAVLANLHRARLETGAG